MKTGIGVVTVTFTIFFAWILRKNNSTKVPYLKKEQIESYNSTGILIIDQPIFSSKKLDEITKILLDKADKLNFKFYPAK